MVEYNSAETLDVIDTYSTDVMTGGSNKRMYLYNQLVHSLKRADSVDIIVSFLMESGVKMLIKEFENALKRGARIRILTGNYLGITQPSALYLIKEKLGDRVDLRFFNERRRSFHPKFYFFHLNVGRILRPLRRGGMPAIPRFLKCSILRKIYDKIIWLMKVL